MAGETKLSGPDLAEEGLPLDALDSDIPSVGHFDGKAVVVLQTGDGPRAVGGTCTHYGGPRHASGRVKRLGRDRRQPLPHHIPSKPSDRSVRYRPMSPADPSQTTALVALASRHEASNSSTRWRREARSVNTSR